MLPHAYAIDEQEAKTERKRDMSVSDDKMILSKRPFSWLDVAMSTVLWLAWLQVGISGFVMCYTIVAMSLGMHEINISQSIRTLVGLSG